MKKVEKIVKNQLEKDRILFISYRENNSIEIRNKIVVKYIPLIKFVVANMIKKTPKEIEFEDLMSYGTLGLLDAIERYDISKNIEFKTYAVDRIRGAIYDELRKICFIPRAIQQYSKQIDNLTKEFSDIEGKVNYNKVIEEFKRITNFKYSKRHYHIMLDVKSAKRVVSLNYSISNRETTKLNKNGDNVFTDMDLLKSDDKLNPTYLLENKYIFDRLETSIKKLKRREQFVIKNYYFNNVCLSEIGKMLCFTESRASQILKKALGNLKEDLKRDYNLFFENTPV